MDLLAYFRVLRRHWALLLVFVVVGAGIGAASTVLSSSGGGSGSKAVYYKATNTLLFKADSGGSTYPSSFNNLEQIALLATTGPVPDAVSQQLKSALTAQQVAERLTTLTGASSGTIAITAVGRQPDETAALANTVADQLVAHLKASDLDTYNQAKADAEKQLATIQGKIDATKGQLAAVPPPANADLLGQQLTALEDQYAQEYGNYQQVTGKDPPASPLTTLQKAQAVQIDSSEYDTRLAQGRLGQNNLQVGGSAPVAAASSTSGSPIQGTLPRGLFGAFFGLLIGIGVVMLREHLDRRVRSREDAEHAYRWPVLADVPLLPVRQQREHEIIAHTKPMSPVAEAYRAVRSSVLFQLAAAERADPGTPGDTNGAATARATTGDGLFEPAETQSIVLMVTSASPGEGKTTSSANLAAVCAQAGSRVLVINCDFRRPMIHEYFELEDLPRRVQATSVAGVNIVTNVVRDEDPNPAQVVATLRQVIVAARDKFDIIILDTAPVLSANDAIDLVADVDVVLVVAHIDVTKTPAAQRAGESLRRVEAPVVGLVLLGSSESENSYYAYYQGDQRTGKGGKAKSNGRSEQDAVADARDEPHDELVKG